MAIVNNNQTASINSSIQYHCHSLAKHNRNGSAKKGTAARTRREQQAWMKEQFKAAQLAKYKFYLAMTSEVWEVEELYCCEAKDMHY